MAEVRSWLVCLLFVAACGGADEPRLMAAASLERVLPEALAAAGVRAVQSYAASSMLARQIELGAEADVFVSADREWVDYLAGQGYLDEPKRIAGNELVIWARASERPLEKVADLDDGRWRRIAVGDEAVPVGRYARTALRGLSLEGRLVPCRDAPSVIRTLLTGEVDAGVAYATDAADVDGLRVIWRFGTEPEVTYWALRLRDGARSRRLLDALGSAEARAVFAAKGFR
jgi:molybdate transport system substrate-binding protein